jgi:alcohol dehydrogenase class IV
VWPDFTWTDGERLIRFGRGAVDQAPALLEQNGFSDYVLLTTERLANGGSSEAGVVEMLAENAAEVFRVGHGLVEDLSAELMDQAGGRAPVAFGGGRVIDVAKALAGAGQGRCVAVPTTLAGSTMTPFHRVPAGVEGARMVRPALVIAEPSLMASQPMPQLAASAMNSLAHAMESLYTPRANPASEMAALRAARLYAERLPALTTEAPERVSLALAGVLAGYAVGNTGLAVHHAVCQTLVRVAGTPHAETNAVMLPHFGRLMAERAPEAMGKLAGALGDPVGSPLAAGGLIARLAARSGHTRLGELGVEERHLIEVIDAVQLHPGLKATPNPPQPDELLRLLHTAL